MLLKLYESDFMHLLSDVNNLSVFSKELHVILTSVAEFHKQDE